MPEVGGTYGTYRCWWWMINWRGKTKTSRRGTLFQQWKWIGERRLGETESWITSLLPITRNIRWWTALADEVTASEVSLHRTVSVLTFQSITVAAPMKWRWVQADGGKRWWRWWRNNTIDRQLAVSAWYNCWGEGGTCWRWSQGNCTGDSVTAVNDKCRLFVVLVAVVVVVERLRNVVQAHANTHLACRQLG